MLIKHGTTLNKLSIKGRLIIVILIIKELRIFSSVKLELMEILAISHEHKKLIKKE